MVLILLSTPTSNVSHSFWPSTPSSFELSSPKTPLTPSPSFFAILSPIFTADDNVPTSPAGFRQVSPGMIPPETPPPWLLGPQSPVRPSPSRLNSYCDVPRPTLSRTTTRDNLRPMNSRERPTFPSTTYSFTAGHAQAFRPPPPLALKRTKTEPSSRVQKSSLQEALRNAPQPVPELTIRRPSGEEPKIVTIDLESESLPIALEVASPVDSECMEVPIALELPPLTQWTAVNWVQSGKANSQSIS